MATWFFSLLAISGFAISFADIDCSDPNYIPPCLENINLEKISKFPETEDTLTEFCGSMDSALNCILDYAKACPDSETAKNSFILGELSKLVKKICNKYSDVHSRFLENAQCLNKHEIEIFEKCDYGTILTSISNPEKDCKEYLKMKNCVYQKIEDKCGEEAASVFKEIGITTDELMKQECDKQKQ